VYQPPPTQRRFEGSGRQLRGALVRHLVREPASLLELTRATGFPAGWVAEALLDLEDEGMIVDAGGEYRLAD
ncbi:MAG: hypothetical protein ACR2NL_11250, partial [Acidimicrobiia bacterium]